MSTKTQLDKAEIVTSLPKWLKSATSALPSYRRYIPAGLTLFAGIGLSVIASMVVWKWEQARMQAELQERLDELATNLQKNSDSNLDVLATTGTFYSASSNIQQQEFQKFIKPTLYRHPSIQAIAWLPRVSDGQRQTDREAAEAEGYSSSQITEQAISGQIIPAQQRQEYFPVYYIFPLQPNKMVLGFDFASNPTYRALLQKSRKQDEIVATNRIKLIQQTGNNQVSFIAFLPIYRQSAVETPSFTSNLKGFVLGVFRIDEIIKTSLQELKLDNINFYLEDATAPVSEKFLAFYEAKTKHLVVDSSQAKQFNIGQKAECPDGSPCTRILNIENRRWLLRFLLTPEYIAPQKQWRVGAVLTIGLILTSIAVSYLIILQRRTQRIEQVVRDRTTQSKQLQATLQELQKTQAQLIQTEKMSSLGQLVAGVAHEINNPVNFIYGNLTHINRYIEEFLGLVRLYQQHYPNPNQDILEYNESIDLDFIINDLPKILSSMKVGTERIREIVLSLQNFSRMDQSKIKSVNIHEGIDNTLMILQSRLKVGHSGIEVIKEYGKLPLVECYPGALNQVFMNILANAIDAHSSETHHKPNRITIRTEFWPPEYVTVRIADNGPGMTEEVKKRLFDPFFTTKPVGKGTGLGLSISYQIVVDRHKGAFWCESTLGQGTEFWVKIPVRQVVG